MSPRTSASSGSPRPLERVMVFVDGGYLRKTMKDLFHNDEVDWIKLRDFFVRKYNIPAQPFRANLIRIYYYDAQVAHGDAEYKQESLYFRKIRGKKQYSLRLGEAVRGGHGDLRQKGVDILIAIDALSKAYQNHYEAAIFLMGDRDFIPLIKAVKDAGKKTYGLYYRRTAAKELRFEFDIRYSLTKKELSRLRRKNE